MIFTPAHIRLIRTHTKTQTRRLVKDRVDRNGHPIRDPYRPGQVIAVQPGRGQRAVARIRVTTIRREPLHMIASNLHDVRAEGFQTLDEFAATWISLHDKRARMADAARATLKGDRKIQDPTGHMLEHFAGVHVWVLTFEYVSEMPLFLAARSDELYTHDPRHALPDEPEAVDPAEVTLLPSSQEARERYDETHRLREAAYLALPLPEKVRLLHELADQGVIDTTKAGPLRELDRQANRALRKALRIHREAA